jgi:phage replication-related protein YjqB (UPF0714/DUF867 family)
MRFAELLAHPGVVEEYRPGSPFGLLAFHGGSLERATDVIARAVADRSGASLYTVEQPDDFRWHLPSAEVDPAASPALAAFLRHVEVAIAIHGYGRDGLFTTLLAGGSHRDLAREVGATLTASLAFDDTRYTVIDDIDAIPLELRGLHPDNPINRVRGGGVQLELPPRVRGLGPYWEPGGAGHIGAVPPGDTPTHLGVGPHGLGAHTEGLIAGLAEVAATWRETPPS